MSNEDGVPVPNRHPDPLGWRDQPFMACDKHLPSGDGLTFVLAVPPVPIADSQAGSCPATFTPQDHPRAFYCNDVTGHTANHWASAGPLVALNAPPGTEVIVAVWTPDMTDIGARAEAAQEVRRQVLKATVRARGLHIPGR